MAMLNGAMEAVVRPFVRDVVVELSRRGEETSYLVHTTDVERHAVSTIRCRRRRSLGMVKILPRGLCCCLLFVVHE